MSRQNYFHYYLTWPVSSIRIVLLAMWLWVWKEGSEWLEMNLILDHVSHQTPLLISKHGHSSQSASSWWSGSMFQSIRCNHVIRQILNCTFSHMCTVNKVGQTVDCCAHISGQKIESTIFPRTEYKLWHPQIKNISMC